ncbi:hypothetical protein CU633_05120 [Bacillus sp. V3-13]|nr:hypothetical protein CU633_05120 [Bacillus sp. V3-13]
MYVGVGFDDIINQNLTDPNTVNGKAIWNSADAIKILKDSKKIAHLKTLDKVLYIILLIY